MSFILDALKKSESERQPQSAAEFTAAPVASASASVPRWLWIVGVLLLINLAVLTGLIFRSNPTVIPETVNREASAPATTVASAANADFAERVDSARRSPPPPQVTSDDAQAAPVQRRDERPVVRPDLISQAPESVNLDRQYPTIHEVRAGGAVSLPDLHLDIHVFSDVPADRFVFINMSKHREGSTLEEGPLVSEITPLGVVLDYSGRTFLLPRE